MKEKLFLFIVEFFLILIVIFSPLFYGSILPQAKFLLEMSCIFLFFLFILYLFSISKIKIFYPYSISLFGIFLLIVIFQIIPLPYVILKIISPTTGLIYSKYIIDFKESFYPLSIYSFNTLQELIKYVCFFSVFFVSINIFVRRIQFERLIFVLVILASILSLYGVMRKYFIQEREITSSFSVFYNRNHYSAYMIMVANLAIGYGIYFNNIFKKFIFSFLGALISASIFLSLSRAGSLSLVFSFLLFVFLIKPKWIKSNFWIIGICLLLVIVFINIAGIAPIKFRFSTFWEGLQERLIITSFGLKIIRDFPFFGIGLGNFPYIFTKYNTSSTYHNYLLNEHLQLTIEVGLVGAFIYFLFLFCIFKDIFSKLKKRHDIFVRSVVVSGVSGLFGVLLHSFFDFNFHIPAISFLFWLLLGFIYKCVHTHFNQ